MRLRYTEQVRGELRSFSHERAFEASTAQEACDAARAYFGKMARETGVGWIRRLDAVEVEPGEPGLHDPEGARSRGD